MILTQVHIADQGESFSEYLTVKSLKKQFNGKTFYLGSSIQIILI